MSALTSDILYTLNQTENRLGESLNKLHSEMITSNSAMREQIANLEIRLTEKMGKMQTMLVTLLCGALVAMITALVAAIFSVR